MKINHVSLEEWYLQTALRLALMEDKMNAICKFLEIKMEVKEKVIVVSKESEVET